MVDMRELQDAFTVEGPIAAFCTFHRGDEIAEGVAVVHSIDPETKTIWLSTPVPAGVKAGDNIRLHRITEATSGSGL
jgi:hypothetical protein